MLEERLKKLEQEVITLHFKNTVNMVYIVTSTVINVLQFLRR